MIFWFDVTLALPQQANVASYDWSALLYLSTAGKDFDGGELLFLDDDNDSQLEPKEGQLVFFSSGLEPLGSIVNSFFQRKGHLVADLTPFWCQHCRQHLTHHGCYVHLGMFTESSLCRWGNAWCWRCGLLAAGGLGHCLKIQLVSWMMVGLPAEACPPRSAF